MPSWPASLPQFVQEQGYDESLPDQTVESPMDSGPPKSRRRFTTAFRPLRVTIWCTAEQAEDFEEFYMDDCAAGSLSFTWVHPRTQQAATFRFRKPAPKPQPFGAGNVAYTFNLWQLP